MLLALLAIDQANRVFTDPFNTRSWDRLQGAYSNTSLLLWNDTFERPP